MGRREGNKEWEREGRDYGRTENGKRNRDTYTEEVVGVSGFLGGN